MEQLLLNLNIWKWSRFGSEHQRGRVTVTFSQQVTVTCLVEAARRMQHRGCVVLGRRLRLVTVGDSTRTESLRVQELQRVDTHMFKDTRPLPKGKGKYDDT